MMQYLTGLQNSEFRVTYNTSGENVYGIFRLLQAYQNICPIQSYEANNF